MQPGSTGGYRTGIFDLASFLGQRIVPHATACARWAIAEFQSVVPVVPPATLQGCGWLAGGLVPIACGGCPPNRLSLLLLSGWVAVAAASPWPDPGGPAIFRKHWRNACKDRSAGRVDPGFKQGIVSCDRRFRAACELAPQVQRQEVDASFPDSFTEGY